jgi:hypothetical protein
MFPFTRKPTPETPAAAEPAAAAKAPAKHRLDDVTGGAFSAATSGERAAKIRDWLASNPSNEQLQDVFKELSSRDKGAARPIRDRLDELKRAKGQEQIAAEWAQRAEALLAASRLNIADAMAWQRDAARAGAPLSREPLAGLRARLSERVKIVEDLQNQAMVQREAAVLLAQRIELLSTKPWRDALAAREALAADVAHWQSQVQGLMHNADWGNVDARYPSQLDGSTTQLQAVWDAFTSALSVTEAAAQSAEAPLPEVPTWADELRVARGEAPQAQKVQKEEAAKVNPEARVKANANLEKAAVSLDAAVKIGQGKVIAQAANQLRQALKDAGKRADEAVLARANISLAAAQELEGWQKWRADQLREELVGKAEALLKPIGGAKAEADTETTAEIAAEAPAAQAPAPDEASAPVAEAPTEAAPADVTDAPPAEAAPAQAAAPAEPAAPAVSAADATAAPAEAKAEPGDAAARVRAQWQPTLTGRKLQEALRQLRDQWKSTDQGGVPNHALWKRFDRACNRAHVFVEDWLTQVRAEAAKHRGERQALLNEVQQWGEAQAAAITSGAKADWKAFNRQLHQFSDRWRNAGHLSEKAYQELQPKWKAAIAAAAAPLDTAQKDSLARRHAMIEEAQQLGDAPSLRIDAIKALQGRWQGEAQAVPIDRKQEQKLWDAFRKPIDDAFQRKTSERQKQHAALSVRDQAVLDAAREVEAATTSGDAQRIRAALDALDAAQRAQAQAPAETAKAEAKTPAASAPAASAPAAEPAADAPDAPAASADGAPAPASEGQADASTAPAAEGEAAEAAPAAEPAPAPKPAPKPVVAMRGDDRPGAKRPEGNARPAGRGDRRDGRDSRDGRDGGRGRDDRRDDRRDGRGNDRGDRFGRGRDDRGGDRPDRGPRLGDAAFRAQRDAVEHAQAALRKLAAQAHGETLGQLMSAWQNRQADALPAAAELGKQVNGQVRSQWSQAVGQAAGGAKPEALLRLEMAADVPTPAEHVPARRALQLQLLTRRNDPSPSETWAQDVAQVLAGPHAEADARRLQQALKALLAGKR